MLTGERTSSKNSGLVVPIPTLLVEIPPDAAMTDKTFPPVPTSNLSCAVETPLTYTSVAPMPPATSSSNLGAVDAIPTLLFVASATMRLD